MKYVNTLEEHNKCSSTVFTSDIYIMIFYPALYFLFDLLYSFLHKQHVVNKTLSQKRFFDFFKYCFCRLIPLLKKEIAAAKNPENVI